MPLNKSKGEMYKWATHTHTHLGGQCPHHCGYCSVNSLKSKPAVRAKYSGPPHLVEKELKVRYPDGSLVFIDNNNDLFAWDVPTAFVVQVLDHCRQYPKARFAFQTKNPSRYQVFLHRFPEGSILGTTIESNRWHNCMGDAPMPAVRKIAMIELRLEMERSPQYAARNFKRFVTIEPVLDFDLDEMINGIREIDPDFVNVGADSKRHNLPEPSKEKLLALLAGLKCLKCEVIQKPNLARLLE